MIAMIQTESFPVEVESIGAGSMLLVFEESVLVGGLLVESGLF